MNNPVNFKLAKLLKEKGYDIDKKYNNYYIENYYYNEDGKLIECEEQSGSLSLFDGKYSAPTIAEVVMWLYEKHNIWVGVMRDKEVGAVASDPYYFTCDYGRHIYNTPIEAYEAVIDFYLNNLR